MQQVSAALLNVIENGIGGDPTVRDLLCLFEFYEPTVLPGVDGFDPADASQRFAQFDFTWLGRAYRRIVSGVTDIVLRASKEPNTCTLTFSNADQDHYFATWVQSAQIEGMRLVVRILSESTSATLADSTVRFVGRCSEPDSIGSTGTIQAKAEVGDANHEFPPRLFTADDPDGRLITDPLYEGFPVVTLTGLHSVPLAEPNRRYRRLDPRRYYATKQWSSYDDTPIGEAIWLILGRVQTDLIDIIFADMGTVTNRLDVIGMGPIEGVTNVRTIYPGDVGNFLSQPIGITLHKGEVGGTGTQVADARFPGYPLFSNTAYLTFHFTGSKPDRIDRGHDTIAVVLGMKVPLPNSSGVFGAAGWTDNGAYHTRFLLTDSRFFGNDPALIEDSACFATGTYNEDPLFDDSNGETVLIPDPDVGEAASSFHRYRSTGLITPRRILYGDFGAGDRPEVVEIPAGEYQDYDPGAANLVAADARHLRERFTTNVVLKERVKGIDFLYDVVLRSYRGLLVWNWRGKIEPRSERPADFAHLRSATLAGATVLPVEDVTPWAAGLWGRVVVGAHLTTSEVRKPSAFSYTSDSNSITLAASGTSGVTLTASGATLTGGTAAVRSSGTATVGGTAGAGRQLILTVRGVAVTYTLTAEDTLNTAAAMLARYVNAHPQLRRFVSAEWTTATPTVVTLRSKWGTLTVPALTDAHAGPVSAPTGTPAFTTTAGTFPAGTYYAAYTYVTAAGESTPSPTGSIVLGASLAVKTPDVRPLPAGVTAVRWYLSKGAGNPEMAYAGTNDGNLLVLAIPASGAAAPPDYNTTGEEVIRVAMAFASNNQTADILARSGLTRGNVVAGSYRYGNLGQSPSFNRVVGTYISASDDFAESKYELLDKALKERMGRLVTREMNLTAVDSLHQARRLVGFEFAKHIDHAKQSTLRGHTPAILLEEGDTYSASDAFGGHVNALWRVEELVIHIADRTFQATIRRGRQYSTGMFDERVRRHQPIVPSVLRWATILNTDVQLLDLPVWRESDADKGLIMQIAVSRAAGTGDWPGMTLWIDSGAGYEQVAATDVEATVGEALTALPDHPFGLDVTNTVRVRVSAGTMFATKADEEIRKGANKFRLGGEICQAEVVTPVAGTTTDFDLSRLHRGLYGTEGEASGHATGDEFTVLDGAVVTVPLERTYMGRLLSVKAVTVRQDVADATPVPFTFVGNSVLPSAVARVERDAATGLAPRGSTGEVLITAHPRTALDRVGDEYLAEFLTDAGDSIADAHIVFRENIPVAALFESDTSVSNRYEGVTKNSVQGWVASGATSTVTRNARSFQVIRAGGNIVDATLEVAETVSSAWSAHAQICLMAAGEPWRKKRLVPWTEIEGPGAGYAEVIVGFKAWWDVLAGATVHSLTADFRGGSLLSPDPDFSVSVDVPTNKVRVRLALVSDTEVKVYWAAPDQAFGVGQPHFFKTPRPIDLPLVVLAQVHTVEDYVRDVILTTNPYPSTVVSLEQQEYWYGAAKSPMRTRIRQHSGIREVGYGKVFEESI